MHVLVINRWHDDYARYDAYLDHEEHQVTYVTHADLVTGVPKQAAEVVIVADRTDYAEVRAAIGPAIGRYGPPSAVVALHETGQPLAARLRSEFGTVGRRDYTTFLDKHEMLLAAQRSGVAVPEFTLARSAAHVEAFAARAGWPVIVKRLHGVASSGVRRLNGPVDDLPDEPLLVQRYVPHPVHHVDGLWDGTALGPWKLSRYLNTAGSVTTGPLAFAAGEPVGSAEIDDPATLAAVEEFMLALLPAMAGGPWVFHLELFVDEANQCTFMEVGCRPGGGEIPLVWREVHGRDLMEWEFALQCGLPVTAEPFAPGSEVSGQLLVPASGTVVAAPSQLGPRGAYAEVIPPVGTVLDQGTTYEFAGGRFRFRGPDTAEVIRRVYAAIDGYTMICDG
ncbi:ATP-grasp domain-containing protein [Longispora albida]|uniref:ATP-grasp domain-containing protein n=1 Tax=Longispora albida TaxID=203523 RepID=UPI0003708497|nr:hypothetical protein [Longispora albida]